MNVCKHLCLGLLYLACSLLLPIASMAADATNPAGTTIPGNWDGTATADNYTNHGTVSADIDMTQGGTDNVVNTGTVGNNISMSNSDGNSVTNSGSVSDITMGSGNYNNVSNETGATANDIFGSVNSATGDSGGQSIITNSGTARDLYGSYNNGANNTGSHNTIINFGTANNIYGSANAYENSSGGENTIDNSGTVNGGLFGSGNWGDGSSGGENTITNSGTVNGSIVGSGNTGDLSSGGDNTITNTAQVDTMIVGSNNLGVGSSGGENSIDNSGTVESGIIGSYNQNSGTSGGSNEINNSGDVNSYIYGSYNTTAGPIAASQDGSQGTVVNANGTYQGGSNTITNSGNVNQSIYGSYNEGASTSGGANTIANSGNVVDIGGSVNLSNGSYGGANTIRNSGNVSGSIHGSDNQGENSSGGGNTIRNSGIVSDYISGSNNAGTGSSGGGNTIINSGSVASYIDGSTNWTTNSSGGSNRITNSGIADELFGSYNEGQNSSGGSNTITNSGTVSDTIFGSYNIGQGASGGSNTITNSGTVTDSIYGSYNEEQGTSGGGNTVNLLASSNVGGDVFGTFGGTDTGTDTLNMFGGAVVGGNVGGFDVFNKRGPGRAVVQGNLNLGGADVHVVMHEFETQVQVDGQVTGATGNLTVDVLGGEFVHGQTVDVFSVGKITTWNSETITENFAEWDLVLLNGQITALFLGQGGDTNVNQPSGRVTSKDTMARQFNIYRRLLHRRLASLLAPRPPRDSQENKELSYNLRTNGTATGLAAGEAAATADTRRWGVWADGALSWQSNNSNIARFHGTVFTSLAGVDFMFNERLVAGLAIGNDQTWLRTTFNDGSFYSSGFVATPYLAYSLLDNLIFDVSGAVGLAYNRQERNRNTFDYDSDYESVRTMIGSNLTYYHLWNNWSFDVGAGFMYANEYSPSYTERGDAYLRNKVRSTDVYAGEFNFTGGVKYYFEYFAPYATVTYLWSPWMTRPDYSNDRDEIEVAFGVDIEPTESFTLSLQVSKSFLRRYVDSTNVMCALRYQF